MVGMLLLPLMVWFVAWVIFEDTVCFSEQRLSSRFYRDGQN